MKKNKGITLLEIMVVIAIIAIIALITVPNLSKFKRQQALKNTTEDIVSLLNEAKNSTISSKNSSVYGVHLDENQAVFFLGESYTNTPSKKEINFDSLVKISKDDGLNLNSGGDDIIFDRLTGNTSNYGTIRLELTGDSTQTKTITVSSIGTISVD